ncbi:hypothetical protein L611_000200000070 [Aminobacter sp. J15]|nr:hypothetical protein L611_000200000070 [Aminobacter sp. J15]
MVDRKAASHAFNGNGSLRTGFNIHACGGFIEDQKCGEVKDRRRYVDATLPASRQMLDALVEALGYLRGLACPVQPLAKITTSDAGQAAKYLEVFPDGQMRIESEFLRGEAEAPHPVFSA